jgi:hypothetical protein
LLLVEIFSKFKLFCAANEEMHNMRWFLVILIDKKISCGCYTEARLVCPSWELPHYASTLRLHRNIRFFSNKSPGSVKSLVYLTNTHTIMFLQVVQKKL